MNIIVDISRVNDPAASEFIGFLREKERDLKLDHAEVYYDFPIFKDLDGGVITSKILLVSAVHGILVGSQQYEGWHEEAVEANIIYAFCCASATSYRLSDFLSTSKVRQTYG